MKLRVLNDKIMVKVATDEEVTKSGIILAPAKQERKYEGIVEGVGNSPDIAERGVKVGSYVWYPRGLNTEVTVDDTMYDIVSIYDVQAVGE